MELVLNPTPPPHMVVQSLRSASSELVCWQCPPLDVRCVPSRPGEVKLLLVTSGGARLKQGGRSAQLGVGEFSFVDLGAPFELSADASTLIQWRQPTRALEAREPHADLRPAFTRGKSHAGDRVIASILTELSRPSVSPQQGLAGLDAATSALGMGPKLGRASDAQWRIARAFQTMDAGLDTPELTAAAIADEQHISRRYLDQLMLAHTGKTTSAQLRERRLVRASRQLREPAQDSISAVAYRAGFSSQSHFCRVFRQAYGMSPSQFRREREPR